MLAVSSKGSYGLAAIFELALYYNKGPLQIKNISEAQGIPQHYLEQLLVKLKRCGLVKSFRGAQGGYELIKKPAEIQVYDVLLCLEGEIEMVNSPGNYEVLKYFWNNVKNEVIKPFQMTIEDLIMENNRIKDHIIYSI